MTDWKAFLDGILTERQYKLDEPMNRHTTYGIGGPADCFVMPQTTEELKKVLSKAHEEGIPVTFIGGGSNLLVSDLGIRGITVCTSRLKQDMTCHETWITAMGGVGTGTISRFAENFARSLAPPLPTEPASLGFGGIYRREETKSGAELRAVLY